MKFLLKILLIVLIIEIAVSVAKNKKSKSHRRRRFHRQPMSTDLTLKTPPTDDGKGSLFYLDRQNVDCGSGKALKGFHLFRPTPTTLLYEYGCVTSSAISKLSVSQAANPLSSIAGNDEHKSANYLDRQTVACPTGQALQQFAFNRVGGNQFRYSFRCVAVKTTECGQTTTAPSDAGTYATHYLDRQYIVLAANTVLTGFKLNSSYVIRGSTGNTFTYTVNWCKLADVDSQIASLNAQISSLQAQLQSLINY